MSAINILKDLAPIVGTVIGSPIGGVVASAGIDWLADKLGLENKTVEAVTDAVMGLDPQKRLELDRDFSKWHAEFSLRREVEYLRDVQDARKRDTAIKVAGQRNKRADAIVACTYIGIVITILMSVFMTDLNEYAKGALSTLLGVLIADWKQITQFEFGSTRDSKVKNESINNLSKGQL